MLEHNDALDGHKIRVDGRHWWSAALFHFDSDG